MHYQYFNVFRLFPAKFSVAAKGLIIGMLHPDPSVRVSVQEAQKHPWCINSNAIVHEVRDAFDTILLPTDLLVYTTLTCVLFPSFFCYLATEQPYIKFPEQQ